MAAIAAALTVFVCVVAGFFEAGDGDGAVFSVVAPSTVAGLVGAKMKYPAVNATTAIATSRPHCNTKSPLPTQRLPQGLAVFNEKDFLRKRFVSHL